MAAWGQWLVWTGSHWHDRQRPDQGPLHAAGLLRVPAAVQAGDRWQPQETRHG
ncbi:MAG: hypothetical protein ACK4JB_23640 [Reyranella sp.]